MREQDATMNNDDGTIVKNNCSKRRLKSNPPVSCSSSAPYSVSKTMKNEFVACIADKFNGC
jgi:hypothetical protein